MRSEDEVKQVSLVKKARPRLVAFSILSRVARQRLASKDHLREIIDEVRIRDVSEVEKIGPVLALVVRECKSILFP